MMTFIRFFFYGFRPSVVGARSDIALTMLLVFGRAIIATDCNILE
jgi:hypothetical protein